MTEKKDSKAWVRLPLSVLADERLTPYDAVIMAILIDRDSEKTQISAGEIAKISGISERKARESLKTLEKAGYIDIKRTGRESIYTLIDPVLPPKKRTWKKKEEDSSESYSDEYEALWNTY